MSTRRAHPVSVLVVTALMLAGCSGGANEVGTSTQSPSNSAGPTEQQPTASPGPNPSPTPGNGEVTSGPTEEPTTPEPDGGSGVDAELLTQARRDVSELDLPALAGQLVIADYAGTDSSAAAAMVQAHGLGGVITLGGNVPEAPADRLPALSDVSRRVHEEVAASGRDWPAFVAIDQEGGSITRVGDPLDRWPSAMALGAAGDPELAGEVAQASGEQLRALGYTAVFAPVADVTIGAEDPTIGSRSFGSDPDAVAQLAQAQIEGYLGAGILPVAKHFPGHGSVAADTHVQYVEQTADLGTLTERDLLPFAELAQSAAPAIMTAHIVLAAVDPEHPATLSAPVLTTLLREDLGFQGLIVTDALNMAAISGTYGPGQAAVLAVQAGADVLLMPPDPGAAVAALVEAVESGEIDRGRLEESAARMVASLRSVDRPGPGASVIGSSGELASTAAAAAVTQLTGTCGAPMIGRELRIVGGTEADRALFVEVAQDAGLQIGTGPVVALLGAPVYQAGGGGGDTGGGVTGDVVVALDVPYRLQESSASSAMLATYGRDRHSFEALLAVLRGETTAPGQLPVDVGEYPIGSGC